jgi:2',3'-cyclic-nucleotide 2'-phosphodiesterase
MRILYIGDVMGEVGLQVVEQILPGLRQEKEIDLVIAQAENVTEGRGITPRDFSRLLNMGVDFCSAGNWSLYHDDILPAMDNPDQPIIRPANYPAGTPGLGYKYAETNSGKVLVVSLLGHIVGRDADKPIDNPLRVIDQILDSQINIKKAAIVVNLHGDYSSEKVILGHYLDGRVSVVVGDHWHVPTADARILPGGTAHITDVGMCGVLDSSLGISLSSVIPRWRDGRKTRNLLETSGRRQFNGLISQIDLNGHATACELIQQII